MSARPQGYAVSVGEIVAGLAASVDSLVNTLLPNAKMDGKNGDEWFIGSTAGEPGRSMAINRKRRPGIWSDFAANEGGDALDLVAQVLFSGAKTEAIKWAKSWLGLDGLDPERLATRRRDAARQDARRRLADEAEDAKLRELAARIFRGAVHTIKGTLADRYLRGRAIDLARVGRQPGVLAFAPRCYYRDGAQARELPALIAAIKRGRELVGIHRTYLAERQDGQVTKAAIVEPKKALGRFRGGIIPLWRGEDPRGWAELYDSDEPETIVLAEGIENALSVVVEDPSLRVGATISLSNMAAVDLPPCINRVIIARDNDGEGSKADQAFDRAVAAHRALGREVREARAPMPHKDFNDWLQSIAGQRSPAGTQGGEYEREEG